jgi:hypothetical protein
MKTTAIGFWNAAFVLLFAAPLGVAAESPAAPKRLSAHVYMMKLKKLTDACARVGVEF